MRFALPAILFAATILFVLGVTQPLLYKYFASKADLVEAFVESVSAQGGVDDQWRAFIAARRDTELNAIITEENLRPEPAREFLAAAFRDGELATGGTGVTKILPPVSRFQPAGGHGETKQRILDRLAAFFERFLGMGT